MRYISLICVVISISFRNQVFAQLENYASDALLFSSTEIGGSARSIGLAGAQTALGADISSAANNPAGIGMCRKSVFTISQILSGGTSFNTFLNIQTKAGYTNFTLGNIGAVFSFVKDDLTEGKFRGGSFSISMARIKDFNNTNAYLGTNSSNSMTKYFIESANGTNDQLYFNEYKSQQFTSIQSLAYGTMVLNPINPGGDNKYQTLNNMVINRVEQSGYIKTKGRINEWDFAGGINYDDKIYIGASLGILGLHYEEDKLFTEKIIDAVPLTTTSFSLEESRVVNGAGIQFSSGVIFAPNDHLKIGLAGVSPTLYSISEEFNPTKFSATFASDVYYPGETSPVQTNQNAAIAGGTNDYILTTPGKINLGLALTNKFGLISTEITSVNYMGVDVQDAKNPLIYRSANNFIMNNFKSTINAKVGAEYRFEYMQFRAGVAYFGDPTKGIDNVDRSKKFLTLGVGYRNSAFFVDLAYMKSVNNTVYSPYKLENGNAPVMVSTNNNANIVATCGIYFK